MTFLSFICFILLIVENFGYTPRRMGFLNGRVRRRLKGRGGGGVRSGSRSRSSGGTSHYSSYRSSATYYNTRASRATSEPDAQDYNMQFSFRYIFNTALYSQKLANNQSLSNFTITHLKMKNAIEQQIANRRDTYKIYSAEDFSDIKNDITYNANLTNIGNKLIKMKVQVMNSLSKREKKAWEAWLATPESTTTFEQALLTDGQSTGETIYTVDTVSVTYTTKPEIGAAAVWLIIVSILICCCCMYCCYTKREKISDIFSSSSDNYSTNSYNNDYNTNTIGETTTTGGDVGMSVKGDKIHDEVANCPGKHGIVYYEDVAGYYDCNDCDYHAKSGDMMYGCRQCNFDLCQGCYDKRKDGDNAPDIPQNTDTTTNNDTYITQKISQDDVPQDNDDDIVYSN